MNPLVQLKQTALVFLVALLLGCFWFLPAAQAVLPPPDGGYSGFNTAEGQNALFNLDVNEGFANTGVGWFSLSSNNEGDFNTATGAGSLLFNSADNNTATGAAALLFNTAGSNNAAVGAAALLNNTEGVDNNAIGVFALKSNTSGDFNNAHGSNALSANVDGGGNNAFGDIALVSNVSGSGNTAIGDGALVSCTSGNSNVVVGAGTGGAITTSSNVIAIGAGVLGESSVFGELNNSCYIGNIHGRPVDPATVAPVFVDADGKLGTLTSAAAGNKMTAPNPQGAQPQAILNKFLKEHKRVEEQESKIEKQEASIAELRSTTAHLQKRMEILTTQLKEQAAQIQKVNARLGISTLQVAENNQ